MIDCFREAEMAAIGILATRKAVGLLAGDTGLPASIAQVAGEQNVVVGAFSQQQVVEQNVAAEILERTTGTKYPLVHVYCGKLTNLLREKFRRFSGDAQMVAEVRVSQDRLEGLESVVQLYADALTQVLDQSRGDWGDGVFYGGGYEISYSTVKPGGKNFIQTAKVTFVLEISI